MILQMQRRFAILPLTGLLLLVSCAGDPPVTPSPAAPTVASPVSGGLDTMVPLTSTPVSGPPAPPPTAPPASPVPASATVEPGTPGGGQVLSDADRQWINHAFSETISLRSYHFVLKLDDAQAGKAEIAGDYIAPDKMYNQGTVSGDAREVLKIGTQVYRKHAGTSWQRSDKDVLGNPAVLLQSYSFSSPYLSDWTSAGREVQDGVAVDHFQAQENGLLGPISAGSFSLWRDAQTGHLYRFQNNTDARPAAATIAASGASDPQVAPTLTAWAQDYSFFEMTFVRWNDATIAVPTP